MMWRSVRPAANNSNLCSRPCSCRLSTSTGTTTAIIPSALIKQPSTRYSPAPLPRPALAARRHHPHRRRPLLNPPSATTSTPGDDAYSNLFNARIFADPERQREFERCTGDLRMLAEMSSKFPEMDTAGKRFFLQAMEESSDRYKIFMKRLELAKETDPAAAQYLRYTDEQMARGGFSVGAMFEGLAQSLDRYRQIVDAEERAEAAGPAEAARFRDALRAEWSQSALGTIDMRQLAEMVSPEDIAKAQADPDFYRAIREISESPTPDVLARWIDHPRIGVVVTAISKMLLQKRGLGGVGGGGGM